MKQPLNIYFIDRMSNIKAQLKYRCLIYYCLQMVNKMTEIVEKGLKKVGITLSKPVLAILCIIFGILVILIPDLVGIILGIFLIIEGVLLLTEHLELKKQQSTQPIQQ